MATLKEARNLIGSQLTGRKMSSPNNNNVEPAFPVKSFYSKNKNKRELEIEVKINEAESKLKKNPLPPELKTSLCGPPKVWQIFFKQDEALQFAREKQNELMTFAFEERIADNEGRRKFMVTHPKHMWAVHCGRPLDQRCTYEVIPQGVPCKLYLDLEFNKPSNPSKDGIKMVDILMRATIWTFQEYFDIQITLKDILILDGSTATKFSQHLIYQHNFAFQDNIHAGNFVRHLMDLLKEGRVPGITAEEQESLFVQNDDPEDERSVNKLVSFCDLAVYTKNRNFRLFLSTKFTKNVPLILSDTNKHVSDSKGCSSQEEAIFLSSLISYFRSDIGQLLSFDENNASSAGNQIAPNMKSGASSSQAASSTSPWAEIDRFISSQVSPNGGSIQEWVYYEKTQTVIYRIQGSRYCSVIGREHKSNHIKYVVNLSNGTFYQSCFDPDCAPLRGPPQPIPAEFLPWTNLLIPE